MKVLTPILESVSGCVQEMRPAEKWKNKRGKKNKTLKFALYLRDLFLIGKEIN